jgi:hypothetical protein
MLDKFLTGENVKVNGEIAGHRYILRTLPLLLIWNHHGCDFI